MPAWEHLSHHQREAIILAIYADHRNDEDAVKAIYEAARGVLMVGALS
jgi:hypothetical protein